MEKYFVVGFGGDLHDTRRDDWASRPLRTKFEWQYQTITNGRELCATLRAGEHTFPGGYRLAFMTSDGEVLSFDAVRENLYQAIWSIRNDCNDGWRVIGCFIVDDCEEPMFCAHTGKQLNEGWWNE